MINTKTLKMITTANDLPETAAYYEVCHSGTGNRTVRYYSLLDKDFNELGNYLVKYTVALDGLRQVQKKDDSNTVSAIVMTLAYNLTDLGNGYQLVEKDENTMQVLKSACEALK